MPTIKLLTAATFLLLFPRNVLHAQVAADTPHIFTLGEVIVTAHHVEFNANTVSSTENSRFNRMDVSHSLNLLPGIHLTAVGPRNESGIYVHGFDLREVPLYLDGIPVYVPYDGYVDLGRFTTFDLSAIQVSKGYSSVLYGPNAIGGAINMVTRKPVQPFEANVEAGYVSEGYVFSGNIGSKMKNTYWQISASTLKRDGYPLSRDFDSTRGENGGKRDNAYSDDSKISAKFGFTPRKGQEYAIGYAYQHGTKGSPVYAGSDTLNALYKSPRYWKWPNWDKQSVYVITNNSLDSNNYIKGRLYYDQFKNKLFSYDDGTYTTISRPYAFKSIYNDYTVGGSIEYGNTSFHNNLLSIAFHFKQDVHRENNEGEPQRTLSDNNSTAAIEDTYRIVHRLQAVAGFSYTLRHSLDVEGYNSNTKMIFNYPGNNNDAFNIQGGLRYSLTDGSSLNLSVSRKTRFATMKDRYSFRLGTAVPNPALKAEGAINYNLDYTTYIQQKLSISASMFYSKIQQTIQNVSNVQFDSLTNRYLSQLQNTGRSEFYGADAAIEYRLLKQVTLLANYSYIVRNNLSNNKLKFTDVPTHKVFFSAQYLPCSEFYFLASMEYNAERFSTSYGAVSPAFVVVNAKVHYTLYRFFSVEGGVNNVFDKNYSLVEGYPEAGRNYIATLIFNY